MYFLVAHYYNTINNTRPTLKLGTPPAHQHINTTIWILTTEEVLYMIYILINNPNI